VNPAEFFAVATEVFFDRPGRMQAEKPDLYGVLQGFYRQDPAARLGLWRGQGLADS
jgi:Mlc titration factor MtfA (ptsG expression regulator)